jgi:Golgi nucleoside diphosphatase
MTNTQLKAQIDSQITNETEPASVTPVEVGGNLKAVVDYADQRSPFQTSESLGLSATPKEITKSYSLANGVNGIAYLPLTLLLGTSYTVIAFSSGIKVYANQGQTSKMYYLANSMVSNVDLTVFETYRFTYTSLNGASADGINYQNGTWKVELV